MNLPALPPGYRWLDPEIDMLTKEETAQLERDMERYAKETE